MKVKCKICHLEFDSKDVRPCVAAKNHLEEAPVPLGLKEIFSRIAGTILVGVMAAGLCYASTKSYEGALGVGIVVWLVAFACACVKSEIVEG